MNILQEKKETELKLKIETDELLDCIDIFKFIGFLCPNTKRFLEFCREIKNRLVYKKLLIRVNQFSIYNKILPCKQRIKSIKIKTISKFNDNNFVADIFQNNLILIHFLKENEIIIEKLNKMNIKSFSNSSQIESETTTTTHTQRIKNRFW